MTSVHVRLVVCLALLAASTPLQAAPSQPAQADANLLNLWQPEPKAALPSHPQG